MGKRIVGGQSDEILAYSKCVRAGHFVYVSGMVAFDENCELIGGGVAAETRQILGDLRNILAEAGCTLDHVVKVNVALPNPDDFDDFEAEYSKWFTTAYPARATICAPLTIPAKIEIEAIAYDGPD